MVGLHTAIATARSNEARIPQTSEKGSEAARKPEAGGRQRLRSSGADTTVQGLQGGQRCESKLLDAGSCYCFRLT